MKNIIVDGPSPEFARGLHVGQAMAYSPRPENPPYLPRPCDTNIKVPVMRLSTYELHCARIAAKYYEITPPLELDQN